MSDILINLFQCHIPLTFHTEPVLLPNSFEHGIQIPRSKRESEQITSVPDITIIYTVLLC